MSSRIPFSIHEYLRQSRYRYTPPQFPMYGKAKEYERFPKIQLKEPATSDMPLATAMQKRCSFPAVDGAYLKNLTTDDVSNLFGSALRMRKDGTRPYPSGGGLYPVETYFIGTLENENLLRTYHYAPETHLLVDLWPLPKGMGTADIFSPTPELPAPACVIFTSMWGRNGIKYGDFGYYLGMLEAGHMAQNMLLSAVALGIEARPMGSFDEETVAKMLDIDEALEQAVYAIMFGKLCKKARETLESRGPEQSRR